MQPEARTDMAKKTRKFKTEVQQLLDLVIHSLYSKKEIFLRELISNASDAIDRYRFESLTDKALQEDGQDPRIGLVVDKDARTLTVSDNGIGMSPEEVESNVGTIANSGTRKFLEALRAAPSAGGPEFIGQFGVGLYSAFMVADKVELVTRRAGESATATRWSSTGAGSYTVEETAKASRGTDITLHLAEGMDDFLSEPTLRRIVREYSNYIAYPIVLERAGAEPETLNSMKAIWRKARGEVSDEEYREFYKHVSHDYTDPCHHVHFHAEGATEFRALLFFPAAAPYDLFLRENRKGVHLYVKNVFITDDCKALLPEYLRFVQGVVDSSDLPLNVSRELLQDDALVRRISKVLVARILKELKELREKDADAYRRFHEPFGMLLKEGICTDYENSDKLKELILFRSTRTAENEAISLHEYVERMPEGQTDIYFLTAASVSLALNSPHLEAFKAREYEVLLLTDPIDDWLVQHLTEYDGKPLNAIDRGDLELGSPDEQADGKKQREAAAETYRGLLAALEKRLADDVKEVRLSNRLTDSSCCLVADPAGMSANMERILRAMHQDVPPAKRILEVNPDHPLLPRMKALHDADPDGEKLAAYAELLLGQALLTEGSPLKDPLRFARLLSDLMVEAGPAAGPSSAAE